MKILIAYFAFLLMPLVALADDTEPYISDDLNGYLCGMYADLSYYDFEEYIQRNELEIENVVHARCTIGDFSKRDANAFSRIVVSNPGLVSFIQHLSRYLVTNGHEDIFIKLIEADGHKYNFFEELFAVYLFSSPDRRKSVVGTARITCMHINNSRWSIPELMYLYERHCMSDPFRLEVYEGTAPPSPNESNRSLCLRSPVYQEVCREKMDRL